MDEDSPEAPLTFGTALQRFAFAQSPSKSRPSSPSPRAFSSQLSPPATSRRSLPRNSKPSGSSHYFKRSASEELEEEEGEELLKDEGGLSPKKKKKPSRPYADPSVYAHLDDRLHDYVREGLDLVCCGINPGASSRSCGARALTRGTGLVSAEMGQHCEYRSSVWEAGTDPNAADAGPTNHYYKASTGSSPPASPQPS